MLRWWYSMYNLEWFPSINKHLDFRFLANGYSHKWVALVTWLAASHRYTSSTGQINGLGCHLLRLHVQPHPTQKELTVVLPLWMAQWLELFNQPSSQSSGVWPGLLQVCVVIHHGLDKLECRAIDRPRHLDFAQCFTMLCCRADDGSYTKTSTRPNLGPRMHDMHRNTFVFKHVLGIGVFWDERVVSEISRVPRLHGFI